MTSTLLFGGSFDPIHNGHLIVCRHAAEALNADHVVLIPSASPPHKQHATLTPANVRVELCWLAVEGDSLFEVSDWETRQSGPSYTLHTVRHFQADLGLDDRLYWLIGLDSLFELSTWYRVGELADACTLVTVGRPGARRPSRGELEEYLRAEQIDKLEAHILSSPLIEISATDIRTRVATGRSIKYLVPEAVRIAIAEREMYRTSESGSE